MIIAIDFDGTCVTHDFPEVGQDIGAAGVLKQLVNAEHHLILYTMRSNVESPKSWDSNIIKKPGNYLDDAVDWFQANGIPLYAIGENPTQKSWTSSKKCYAELYIDDAALGIPLKFDRKVSSRPFVDWVRVRELLVDRGIL